MNYGMIGYVVVPHSKYPAGSLRPSAAFAIHEYSITKNDITVYHMGMYAKSDLEKWFVDAYTKQQVRKQTKGKAACAIKKQKTSLQAHWRTRCKITSG